MDRELIQAATSGDKNFLKKRLGECKSNNQDYTPLLTHEMPVGNIFHVATMNKRNEFMESAIEGLPPTHVHTLFSQDMCGKNPLHIAVSVESVAIVKLILHFYKKHLPPSTTATIININDPTSELPWLVQDHNGNTPLHSAFKFGKQKCGLEILLGGMDHMDLALNMLNKQNESPRRIAVMDRRCDEVSLKILTSGASVLHVLQDIRGDVNFLGRIMEECKNNKEDYSPLLSYYMPKETGFLSFTEGNIFHVAASERWNGVFQVAMERLHPIQIHSLLSQNQKESLLNPLHLAARNGSFEIVKLILDFYKTYAPSPTNVHIINVKTPTTDLPWLALDKDNNTPLHLALESKRDECGMEILGMYYMDLVLNMINKRGNSPLYLAVASANNKVALSILKPAASRSYRLCGENGSTPLHVVYKSSGEVFVELLNRHPKLIDAIDKEGQTVLHKWLREKEIWPLEIALFGENTRIMNHEIIKRNLINKTYAKENRSGDNPFHILAEKGMFKASTILVKGYNSFGVDKSSSSISQRDSVLPPPWKVLNDKQETAVDVATRICIAPNHTIDSSTKCMIEGVTNGNYDRLFDSISDRSTTIIAKDILDMVRKFGWTPKESKILGDACKNSDEVAQWVAKNFPESISELDNNEIDMRLHDALVDGRTWFVKAALRCNPQALREKPEAWIKACEKGHLTTVLAFIENCHDFRKLCLDHQQNPLQHINSLSYEEYKNFLNHTIVFPLKNIPDSAGSTPLHNAISNGNLCLTEALLVTSKVNRNIKNRDRKTSMDLLLKECREKPKWDLMCKRIGIIPRFKTTYFQDKTNLLDVRNTLSVVAALLATITFTAGFTLPGGVQSDTSGKPTLGNKAAFLVFLIADTNAMCCSMLVLICLVWSMTSDQIRSLVLIDSSMTILLLALYNTIVAFMTGIYVVTPHKSLWIAIVILVICSIFIVLSVRTVICNLIEKLYTVVECKNIDGFPATEEGRNNQGGDN